ncbi:hypothetical protein FQN49_005801 [Arthroderma sp. PD_2]|nr:hypothetical protein FQN49_005801 [Arthroderma sp. PD_2]
MAAPRAPSILAQCSRRQRLTPRLSLDRRRYISAYGYTQAKALVFPKYGEPKDVLNLHAHSISPPNGTQCTLRLLAAPLNPADFNQIQGVYPTKPTFLTTLGTIDPHAVAGNEGAFEVLSTGSGVKSLRKGDWVIMKHSGMGTWRTHAQFDESQLIKVEEQDREGLTPIQAGTVSVNPVTAYRMIKDFCEWDWLRSGEEWLIQNGANSGVGRAAIQIAKQWNIKTINVIRDRETVEETDKLKNELLSLGATAVIAESELLSSAKFKDIVHQLTRGGREPVRLALNCVGGKNAAALAKVLAPNSRHVTYGAMAKQPTALPAGLMIFNNIAFHGFWVSRWSDKHPALKEETIRDIFRLTRDGKFKDIPVQEVKWTRDTPKEELIDSVQGTLGGYRSGKGVFVYNVHMLDSVTFALLGLAGVALSSQPQAPDPIPAPLRDLTWGQLNFLHTTDVHGAGHRPSFSADWGDYVSFATRMRERAEAAGTDLLVIDTGDRVEGNGLYDSSEPKGVYASEFLKKQHIDLLCSGNHELYKKDTSEAEFLTTVPNFKGKYLASNIDITDPDSSDVVPLAPRFKKFTTKVQGIRIMAFGFLFDFNGNYNNTVVTTVEETIKNDWFQDAIRDREVDLFLILGHVPAKSKEYTAIFTEIRSVQWDTPIQFFAGHYHIRDYVKYDSKAYSLASGRFMETIGFASISGLNTTSRQTAAVQSSPSFSRRYIDSNLYSFYHHSGLDEKTFHTPEGEKVTEDIRKARSTLELDHIYGCAPRTLWMSRSQYPSDDNIYTWLENEVLPDSLEPGLRENTSALAFINTGGIRFDIFKGPFTQDGAYISSPFKNEFRYMKDVPYDKAVKFLQVLNQAPGILSQGGGKTPMVSSFLCPPEQLSRDEDLVVEGDEAAVPPSDEQSPLQAEEMPDLIPGYTTKDDAGTDGDDTIHAPVSFYQAPNCIMSSISADASLKPPVVDLLYLDFLEPWITVAAKVVGVDFDPEKDAKPFMPGVQLRTMITEWVSQNWKCPESP